MFFFFGSFLYLPSSILFHLVSLRNCLCLPDLLDYGDGGVSAGAEHSIELRSRHSCLGPGYSCKANAMKATMRHRRAHLIFHTDFFFVCVKKSPKETLGNKVAQAASRVPRGSSIRVVSASHLTHLRSPRNSLSLYSTCSLQSGSQTISQPTPSSFLSPCPFDSFFLFWSILPRTWEP